MQKLAYQLCQTTFLILSILTWPVVSFGQNSDRAVFTDWVGSLPTKRMGEGINLFQHPPFQKGLEAIIPLNKWQEILREYDFNQPVAAVGEWLVIIGQHHYRTAEDVVIFLHPAESRMEAICQSYILMEWYVATPDHPAGAGASMKIEYYQSNGKQLRFTHPLSENCANNDAQLAVKRLKEVAQQQ